MTPHLYILRDHIPVPEPDSAVWAAWFKAYDENRKVARTYLCDGALVVHTSFLGIDHNFTEKGPPLLFETMIEDVLRETWWDEQWRCATWDEAAKQHSDVCHFIAKKMQMADMAEGNTC